MNMCSCILRTDSACCCDLPEESGCVASLSPFLKLVSETSRLKLLCKLSKGEHCVCELAVDCKMSQSLISHHLSDLRQASLVEDSKQGVKVYYRLSKLGQEVVSHLEKFCLI